MPARPKSGFKRQTSQTSLISSLAIKFPVIRKSCKELYDAFSQCCDEQKIVGAGIHLEQMESVLKALCPLREFSKEEIEDIFKRGHIESAPSYITFREFVVSVAVGYFLDEATEASIPEGDALDEFVKIQKGFKIVKKIFTAMDLDDNGSIDVEELKKSLFATSSSETNDEVLEERFKELDLNHDNEIEFKEFLWGITHWIGIVSSEEDENSYNAEGVNGNVAGGVDDTSNNDNSAALRVNFAFGDNGEVVDPSVVSARGDFLIVSDKEDKEEEEEEEGEKAAKGDEERTLIGM